MSKAVKKIARIALPIAGFAIGGPIGAAIGGGIGGAIGGGGLKGALLGAATGYAGGALAGGAGGLFGGAASGGGGILGSIAGTPLSTVAGNVALQGPTAGSGILGAVTGGGLRSLTQAVPNILSSPGSLSKLALGIGNQLVSGQQADAAEEAAQLQYDAAGRAIQTQQSNTAPYRQLGADAVQQIGDINADRAGYIQNNPLYQSLAKDAEQRLLSNQAAKGKVGSGGTAAALQDQLLQIGNGLVNTEIGQLQGSASIGGNAAVGAANQISNLQTQQGNAQASGVVGSANAQASGYQNQINTLLALQNVNKAPAYQPELLNL